ncbi:uncharacterized protein LOC119077791 [Bradysia coprophila]|uniref:uncharacterized protein LOC119077791 n=1 Tax=Bradysia coprophila TaxID=38358 RepID=UPI00187DD756|nr:uncharacterized protein LOC119077791 [Bradysia coprophila]
MDLIALIFWLMFLVNSISTDSVDETYEASAVPQLEYTTRTIETTTISTIDVLQNQLNQILVQFCASEIDRNKTASAILKFGQLVDAKSAMKNVVGFYVDNYEDSFDNLLLFIDQIPSLELQNVAYNTLVEATKSNQINVINLLSLENFIRTKFESMDEDNVKRKMFENLLLTVGNQIKELIVATDLNRLITVINSSKNPGRIFELIPRIVQGIDLTNFSEMDRIFQFSMQLPKANQLKLISEVLSEMRRKTQYQHLFHVILQVRILRNAVNDGSVEECLLSTVEREIPSELNQLLSDSTQWQIKYFDSDLHSGEYLYFSNSEKYSKYLLFLRPTEFENGWKFLSAQSNSVLVYHSYYYLSVEYCFHNESFPTAIESDSDLSQNNWYILMSNDLTYVQIKNIYTNELLIAENIQEIDDERKSRFRVALSANCLDCDASKWLLESNERHYLPRNSVCPKGY